MTSLVLGVRLFVARLTDQYKVNPFVNGFSITDELSDGFRNRSSKLWRLVPNLCKSMEGRLQFYVSNFTGT